MYLDSEHHPDDVHILVVEDEAVQRKLLERGLQELGCTLSFATTGAAALTTLRRHSFNLVLLDILLPDFDGFEVCRQIRAFSDIPVMMVTALDRPEEIVNGFEQGADDYITKPFNFAELRGRIVAILRRVQWLNQRPNPHQIIHHGVELDEQSRDVSVNGEAVHLSPIEFGLLNYLMNRPDQPVSKEELFRNVWGYTAPDGLNLVEVGVRRLRSKIETHPSKPARVITVHTVGYKFSTRVPASE